MICKFSAQSLGCANGGDYVRKIIKFTLVLTTVKEEGECRSSVIVIQAVFRAGPVKYFFQFPSPQASKTQQLLAQHISY